MESRAKQPTSQARGLSTTEVVAITGMTRRMLNNYVEKGIVAPERTGSSQNSEMRWTLAQANMASEVPALLRAGFSLEQITALANDGTRAVANAMRAQYTKEMRHSRRKLKGIVCCGREAEDFFRVGRKNGTYLRYIPQRWMALMPARKSQALPGSPEHIGLLANLLGVGEVVGWAVSETSGALVSLANSGERGTAYVYIGLASPPMPAFTGRKPIDGGCYFAIDPNHGGPGCDGTECDLCARFGRPPTPAEKFLWNEMKNAADAPPDRTVLINELDDPYPTGTWSNYTEKRLGRDGEIDEDLEKSRQKTSPTVKPRLMPHEVRLPLNTTACVMPAGTYLRFQCEDGAQRDAYQRILGLASAIPHREFTLEDELSASATSPVVMENDAPSETGPVAEPFAVSRAAGDPRMKGWFVDIAVDELHKLTIPVNMALAPEDGYCIVCAEQPVPNRNEPSCYEVQLLVDATKIAPPPEEAFS